MNAEAKSVVNERKRSDLTVDVEEDSPVASVARLYIYYDQGSEVFAS